MTESWGWNSNAEKNPPESYPRSLGNTSPPLEEFKRYGELIELKAIIKPRPGPASDHIDSTSHKNCINTINLSFYSSTQDDWSLIKNEKTQSKQKQNKKPQPNQTKTKPKPFSRDRGWVSCWMLLRYLFKWGQVCVLWICQHGECKWPKLKQL